MSTLGTHPERDSAIGSSRSSDLNVPSPEGKKKFKLLPHKWTESSDSKSSQAPGQANLCINGSHVYTDEPEARNGRAGSNFSLGSSGHGSLEDLRKSSTASSDSFKPPCHVPEITVEEENSEEEEEKARRKEKEEEKRKIAEMKALEIKRLEEERIKEKKRKEEERLKKEEEERKKMEEERIKEKKRKEEERLKKEEEERKKMEEERIKEKQKEERLKREEDRRRFEEEMKKLEEERIMKVKKKEEQERVRKEEEEHNKLEQEEKRRSEEIKRKEEERIKKEWEEQERRRVEEEGEKKKKAKAAEEEQLREKEKRRMIEEEQVRRQDEERKLSEKRKMEEEDQAREQEKKLIEEKRIRKAEDELRMKEERDKREQEERKKAEREREKEKIRSEEERYRKEANEEKKREAEERTKRDEQKKKARDEERRIEVEENDRKITEAKKEEERKNVEEVKKRNSEEAKMVQAKAATVSRNPFEDDSTNPFDETPSTNPFEEIPSPPGPLSRTPRVSAVKPSFVGSGASTLVFEASSNPFLSPTELKSPTNLVSGSMECLAEAGRVEKKRRAPLPPKKSEAFSSVKPDLFQRNLCMTLSAESHHPGLRERKGSPDQDDSDLSASKRRAPQPPDPLMGDKVQNIVDVKAARVCLKMVNDELASSPPVDNGQEGESSNSADEGSCSNALLESAPGVPPDVSTHHFADSKIFSRGKGPAPKPQASSVSEKFTPVLVLDHLLLKNNDPEVAEHSGITEEHQTLDYCANEMNVSETKTDPEPYGPEDAQSRQRDGQGSSPAGMVKPDGWHELDGQCLVQDLENGDAQKIPNTGISSEECNVGLSRMKSRAPLPPTRMIKTTPASLANQTSEVTNLDFGGHKSESVSESPSDHATASSTPPDPLETPGTPKMAAEVQSGLKAWFHTRVLPSAPRPAAARSSGGKGGGKAGGPTHRPHAVKPLIPTENQSGHNSLEVQDINPAGKPPSVPARTKASQSDTKGPYSMLTREELISLLVKQQEHLSQKDCRIVELEQYIDNLLVRVMEEQPSILMTLSASKKAH
ncbi:mitogen-activated protein kinase kinase kinase kinase 4 isoform X2 [Denticeps clupeoides]|nr:mitogen-activated protein kinase kinase kinase kinase 4-like isoform X2 [Denticeps clupeoides]